MKYLYGKTILLTGASSGIGREMTKQLVKTYGASVIGIGRNEEKLKSLKTELGDKFNYYAMDVSVKENWLDFANKLKNLKFEHWIVSEKNRILNLPIEKQINFLLIFDSINCSFWGEPKWTVKLDSGENADGSFALMEKLLDYYEKNDNLTF